MRNSYQAGYRWAGPSDSERADTWIESYSKLENLPYDRTVFFDYDVFIMNPETALRNLKLDLHHLGIPNDFDPNVLEKRYAQSLTEMQGITEHKDQSESFNAVAEHRGEIKLNPEYLNIIQAITHKIRNLHCDVRRGDVRKLDHEPS